MKNILILLVLLSACKKESDGSLINKWKVSAYVKNNNSISQAAPNDIFITFYHNKTVALNLEINSCSSEYTVEKNNLTFAPFSCTEACCDSEFSSELITILSEIKTYSSSENEVTLIGDNEQKIRLTLVQ